MAHLIKGFLMLLLPGLALSLEQQPLPFLQTPGALEVEENFCESMPRERLCGVIPHDVSGFTASKVYMLIERSSQNPFDLFAWKTFVALNWPANAQPLDHLALNDYSGPTLWETWEQPRDVFYSNRSDICGDRAQESGLPVFDAWRQADGNPLVDRWGNYLVYDVRINPEMTGYIRRNGLETPSGQENMLDSAMEISFPTGFYDAPETRFGGRVGSIAVKFAWRVLPSGQRESGYYALNALLALSSADSVDNAALCLPVRLGMVGMHIMRRTRSANGDHWIWATFEHDDNAPYSRDARGPNNIFADDLFPGGCPVEYTDKPYLLFDPQCVDCPTNRPPEMRPGGWKWSATTPHARFADGSLMAPAQISRCWRPAVSTHEMNLVWKRQLRGTIWSNYSLSTTQWKGAPEGALFPAGEVPRYLTNSTMESFLQSDSSGSCLGCHSAATTLAGQDANGSFLMRQANDQLTLRSRNNPGSPLSDVK